MKTTHERDRKLGKQSVKRLVMRHQHLIQIAANGAAVLSATTGALALAIEISPWLPAGLAFAACLVALPLLQMKMAQCKELEQLLLAAAKREHDRALTEWQASHQGRSPNEAELAVLAATHRSAAHMLGHDTQAWDDLIADLVAQAQRRQ